MILRVENLSCIIDRKKILSDIDFSIDQGEFISIVGPNGSGKTTLLRSILGVVPYQQGQIEINGKPLLLWSRKALGRQFAYVPQRVGELPDFSVWEFVAMGRYPHSVWFSSLSVEDKQAIENALILTETEPLAKRPLAGLSGGEIQKVLLASAVCQGAEILLLDEPTASLDPHHEDQFYRLLHSLHNEHSKTILLVSHDLNRAALSSGRVLGLSGGRIFFDGDPEQFMSKDVVGKMYDLSFLFVSHPNEKPAMTLPQRGEVS